MELTLAVISDLHCHHSSSGYADSLLITDLARTPMANHPVSALLYLIESRDIRADAVLMPGDITNKVDQQGMISGWGFVREIAEALRAPIVAPTLGNHDVNSRVPGDDPFHLAKALFPQFPCKSEDVVNEFWARGFCKIESDDFRILIVNSVASHTNEVSAKRGLVSDQQLSHIRSFLTSAPRKKFQIAVFHHHPMLHEDINLGTADVMENGSLLMQTLSEGDVCLVVHGHKHHPKLSYAPGASPLPVLAAGSFSAGLKYGLATRTRNVFHLLTLNENVAISGLIRGTVKSWQFQYGKGWTPASCDAVDFPHRTGFGCYAPPRELS
jgi:3',5'-cyclic AMP phosphodiesterase CpdA